MELRMTSSVPSPPSAAGMDVTCASGMTSSAAFFMMAQRRAEERLPLKESGISRIFTIRFRSEKSAGGLRARPEPHRRPHPHASDGVREKSPYIISILRAFCTIHARRDTSARLLSARSARPYEPHPSRLACTSSATPKR